MKLKITVGSKPSETCPGASMTVRKVEGRKDENSDLVTDSHRILARWSNYFSQLLNLNGVNDFDSWHPRCVSNHSI
jgi:hypothetical protein